MSQYNLRISCSCFSHGVCCLSGNVDKPGDPSGVLGAKFCGRKLLWLNRSIKWSLVSLTLWCALTQLSQRYSLQTLHTEEALLPSSQELHHRGGPSNSPFSKSSCETITSNIFDIKILEGRLSTPPEFSDTTCVHVGHASWPRDAVWYTSSKHLLQNECKQGRTLGSSKVCRHNMQANCSPIGSDKLAI